MDDLAHIFNQLDSKAKDDVLGILEYPNAVEIAIVETVAESMQRLDKGVVSFENLEKK